jgi:tetratricopeptide (TPR) repeat protein
MKLLTPEMLLERLSARLDLLTGGPSDLPERQQTLRNTLDWSYSLLDQDAQTLFSILSVFAGGFTIEAAQSICEFKTGSCELDVLGGLEVLLDNSLLRREVSAPGETRFHMLETIREYAHERLTELGHLEAVRDQHTEYYINKMVEINLSIQTSASEANLDWIEAEHDNLRATLAWVLQRPAFLELGSVMLASMGWFWFRRGYLSEGRDWSRKMLRRLDSGAKTPARVLTLFSIGALAMWQGDLKEALLAIDQSLEIAREVKIPYYLAIVLLFKGTILVNMGQDAEALPFLEQARSLFEDLDILWYAATTQVHMANAALGQGEIEKAVGNLTHAAEINDEIGEKWLQSFILNNFGEVSRVRGEYDLAGKYYRQSENLFREMGDTGELARLVQNLGYIDLHQGEIDEAEAKFQESLSMFTRLNNQRGIAESLTALAGIRISQSEFEKGAQLLGAGSALLEQTGGAWWPADRVEIERIRNKLEEMMEPDQLKAEISTGGQMKIQAALTLAESSVIGQY